MPDGLAGIGAEQGVFAVAGAICVVSAANAVLRRDPLTSALSLTLTLFSLAILYLGLDAPFLAAVQVAVYAGFPAAWDALATMKAALEDFDEASP